MKYILSPLLFICLSLTTNAQQANPRYDKALADSLGSDDYGMKQYFLVVLKTGSNTTTDKTQLSTLFRGHMDNINRLAKAGQLVVAGPLGKNPQQYRGIFILSTKSRLQLDSALQTDPAIKAGIFSTEVYDWYGSAALPMYLGFHERIEKEKH